MKKLWFVLIAVLLFVIALLPNVAVAEEVGSGRSQNSDIYAFVEELCERQRDDKLSERAFLKEKFAELLGENAVEEQDFTIGQEKYVNLVAKITKNNEWDQIIIGAHYDTVSEGAGDNACGVAALYLTMQHLAKENLPFNIVFVAFDGEEYGLMGSEYYVGRMSQKELKTTLVMFNFDTIATGDDLYLMCENKPTDLAKLILSKADGILEKPYAKGVYGNVYDPFDYGYYEMVQGSDHTPFRLAGIPIAFFFSGAFTSSGYVESIDPTKTVINTSADTFENLVAKHPNFQDRIITVSDAVVNTVKSDKFLTIDARKQLVNLNLWYNVLWPILVVIVIAIAAIVLGIFYYRKLQKNAILGESEIKSQKVFDKPKAEDIFSFKEDDSDDIFTFKQ